MKVLSLTAMANVKVSEDKQKDKRTFRKVHAHALSMRGHKKPDMSPLTMQP